MARDTTMLELVEEVGRYAGTEEEVIATVVALVSSETVRLCGNFKGRQFGPSILDPSWGVRA